jgi:hypothetical protein
MTLHIPFVKLLAAGTRNNARGPFRANEPAMARAAGPPFSSHEPLQDHRACPVDPGYRSESGMSAKEKHLFARPDFPDLTANSLGIAIFRADITRWEEWP